FFFFFFSSRRRHTRSKRDWSSDVCSSDLVVRGDHVLGGGGQQDVALQIEACVFIDGLGAGKIGDRSGLLAMIHESFNIEPAGIEIGRASCRERGDVWVGG